MAKLSSLHYRGFTLVDRGRSKFASRDGTNEPYRVCMDTAPQSEAIRKFRAKVDEVISCDT